MARLLPPGPPARSPLPPRAIGDYILSDVLPSLGLTIAEAAERMGTTRQAFNRVCRGISMLTPDLAARLGRLAGLDPRTLLAQQADYELWWVEEKFGADIRRIKPQARRPPD